MIFFKLPSKEKLALKLINYPALNSLVCLILYELWFRVALFAALLLDPTDPRFADIEPRRHNPRSFTPITGLQNLSAKFSRVHRSPPCGDLAYLACGHGASHL